MRPRVAQTFRWTAVAEALLGQPKAAAEAFRQAVELNPEDEPYTDLVLVVVSHNKLEAGLAALREVTLLRPDEARAFAATCMILDLMGRLSEAVDACETAIRLQPSYALVYAAYASPLRALGRADEARRALRQSRELAQPRERTEDGSLELEELLEALPKRRDSSPGDESLSRGRATSSSPVPQ